jgi:hypothetical protein
MTENQPMSYRDRGNLAAIKYAVLRGQVAEREQMVTELRAWALQMANAAAETARIETKPERREWHHGAEHMASALLTWIGTNWIDRLAADDPTHYDGRPDTPEEQRRISEALGEHRRRSS